MTIHFTLCTPGEDSPQYGPRFAAKVQAVAHAAKLDGAYPYDVLMHTTLVVGHVPVRTPEKASIVGWSEADDEMRHAYRTYRDRCVDENLGPHSFHMWQIHSCPAGPLG